MRAAGASYAGRLCAGRSWLLAAHHVRRHVTRRQRRLKRNAVRAAVCHFTAPKRWASRRMLSMLHRCRILGGLWTSVINIRYKVS